MTDPLLDRAQALQESRESILEQQRAQAREDGFFDGLLGRATPTPFDAQRGLRPVDVSRAHEHTAHHLDYCDGRMLGAAEAS